MLRNAVGGGGGGGVSAFTEKSVTRGWVGVKFPGKSVRNILMAT